jgi:hypothetical protein
VDLLAAPVPFGDAAELKRGGSGRSCGAVTGGRSDAILPVLLGYFEHGVRLARSA